MKKLPGLLIILLSQFGVLLYADDHTINTDIGATLDLDLDTQQSGTVTVTPTGVLGNLFSLQYGISTFTSAGTGIWTIANEGVILGFQIDAIVLSNIDTATISQTGTPRIQGQSRGIHVATTKGDLTINNAPTLPINTSIEGLTNEGMNLVNIGGNTSITNVGGSISGGTIGINLGSTAGTITISNSSTSTPGTISGDSGPGISFQVSNADIEINNGPGSSITSNTVQALKSEQPSGSGHAMSINNTGGADIQTSFAEGIILTNHSSVSITNSDTGSTLSGWTDAIQVNNATAGVSLANSNSSEIRSFNTQAITANSTTGPIDITNESNASIKGKTKAIVLSETNGSIQIKNDSGATIEGENFAIESTNTTPLSALTINNLAGSQIFTTPGSTGKAINLTTHTTTTINNDDTSKITGDNTAIASQDTAGSNSTFILNNTNTSEIIGTNANGIDLLDHGNVTITNTSSKITGKLPAINTANSATMGALSISNTSGGELSSSQEAAVFIFGHASSSITNNAGTITALKQGIMAKNVGSNGLNLKNQSVGKITSANSTAVHIENMDGTVDIENSGASEIEGIASSIKVLNVAGSLILANTNSSRLEATGSGSSGLDLDATKSAKIDNTDNSLIKGNGWGVKALNGATTENFNLKNDQTSMVAATNGYGVSVTGYKNITITNNNNSKITGTVAGIAMAGLSGDIVVSNANESIIDGSGAFGGIGISVFHPGTLSNTSTINNFSRISGNTGPAISFIGGSTNIVNLYENSLLTTLGPVIIAGVSSASSNDIVNLYNSGPTPQTGNIASFETLNMNGVAWSLNGSSTIDKINVNSGILTLNGSVAPANTAHLTEVFSGASLKGNALISGDLKVNSGATHLPGNSIDTQTISGTYTLNGTLEVEYDTDTAAADLVVASTKAEISGATVDNKKINGSTIDGAKYKFLTTPNLVADSSPVSVHSSGTNCDLFDGVTTSCFGFTTITNPVIDFHKQTIRAEKNASNFELFLLSTKTTLVGILQAFGYTEENGLSLAQNIDLVATDPNSPLGLLKTDLIKKSPSFLATLMTQAAPSVLGDLGYISNSNQVQISRLIVDHANDLRTHNPPVRKTSVWLQPFADYLKRDNLGQFTGFNTRTYGFALGLDHFFCGPHFNIGGIFGAAGTHLDWKRFRGNAKIDGLFLGTYASWKDLAEDHTGYHIDASLIAGHHRYDVKRNIPLLGLIAKSEHKAWSIDARLGGGYIFGGNDMIFEPFAYIDYLCSQERGYIETGAGPLNQSVRNREEEAINLEAGTNLSQDFKLNNQWVFTPKLNLGWVNSTPIKKQKVNSGFPNQAGFTVQSFQKTINLFAAGLNALFIYKDNLFLSAFYNTEIGKNQTSHKTGLKGSYRF